MINIFGKVITMKNTVIILLSIFSFVIAQNGGKSSFTDSRDGKSYRIVTIGGKQWMAENLNYETSNSWCYGGTASNCDKYGRLYTWNAAMGGASSSSKNPSGVQGACPSGWHLPSRQEWDQLMTSVGGSSTAGKKLKSQTGWYDNGNGTDDYGFSALPGGYRYTDGSFGAAGNYGSWWSATEYDSGIAYRRFMYYDGDYVVDDGYDKDIGYSVRCLRDD
jgi:uncharacterized protein (TIGR02145 family)